MDVLLKCGNSAVPHQFEGSRWRFIAVSYVLVPPVVCDISELQSKRLTLLHSGVDRVHQPIRQLPPSHMYLAHDIHTMADA